MKVLLVYAHPEPSSFNAALREVAIETMGRVGNEVEVSDLYAMKFNPVAGWHDFEEIDKTLPRQYGVIQKEAFLNDKLADDIRLEQEKLAWCDLVLFQFPLWWFGVPAILKGWFDRVIAAGFAYDKDKWFDTGLLKPRKTMLSVTTQSPLSAYQTDGMHGPIESYLKPIHHTLRFAGIQTLEPFIAYGVMNIDDNQRKAYLGSFQQHIEGRFRSF